MTGSETSTNNRGGHVDRLGREDIAMALAGSSRSLEGRRVSLALRDGSRIDDCQVISAGRHGIRSVWLFVNGADTFVTFDDIVDIWEPSARRSRAA